MEKSKGHLLRQMNLKTDKSLYLQDIRFTEKLKAVMTGTFLSGSVIYLFYNSWNAFFLIIPGSFAYFYVWRKDICAKKEMRFREQFKSAIQFTASFMNVGYSIENALRETVKELRILYKKNSRIVTEFQRMIYLLDMNMAVEDVMKDFALRVRQEDAQNFVIVFTAVSRSGGNALEVIRSTVRDIAEKLEVETEIQTLLSARKLEFKIMCFIPLGIIFYMRFSFPEFMKVLYGNILGVTLMSVCLSLYIAACVFGRKITDIEV